MVLRFLWAVERGLDAILQRVLFLGMAALIGVMTLQIVSRVFFTATPWTEELARFLLVWMTFLGATLAYQRGRHIAVTVVVDLLPPPLRRVCRAATSLVAIGFLAVLVIVGYAYMDLQSFQTSPSLRIPMNYVYAVIPASAALMIWFALVDLLEACCARSDPTIGPGSSTVETPDP